MFGIRRLVTNYNHIHYFGLRRLHFYLLNKDCIRLNHQHNWIIACNFIKYYFQPLCDIKKTKFKFGTHCFGSCNKPVLDEPVFPSTGTTAEKLTNYRPSTRSRRRSSHSSWAGFRKRDSYPPKHWVKMRWSSYLGRNSRKALSKYASNKLTHLRRISGRLRPINILKHHFHKLHLKILLSLQLENFVVWIWNFSRNAKSTIELQDRWLFLPETHINIWSKFVELINIPWISSRWCH